jgi:nanoRNase/pAp phosphatase (c-di-AMP/oligoRNAs hydrolase)
MFPEAVVSVNIRYDNGHKEKVAVSVGHSIFNRNCNVNVGLMLSNFEGGGHRGAGSCRFHVSKAQDYIPKILDILLKNKDNED